MYHGNIPCGDRENADASVLERGGEVADDAGEVCTPAALLVSTYCLYAKRHERTELHGPCDLDTAPFCVRLVGLSHEGDFLVRASDGDEAALGGGRVDQCLHILRRYRLVWFELHDLEEPGE